MPPFFEIAVARFGQSPSCVSWAIVVVFMPATGQSMVYKLSTASSSSSPSSSTPASPATPDSGSAGFVALDVPQSVTLREGMDGYLGRVAVGRVDQDRLHQFSKTLMALPVSSASACVAGGEPVCRQWAVDALASLRDEGHFVEPHVTKQWLVEKLGK